MIYEHWKLVPQKQSIWPWEFFKPQEVACHGTGRLLIVPEFLDRIDLLRRMLGSPIRLLSGYRSPYHNARVGGAVFSRHLKADAGDLSTVGLDRKELLRLARSVGFTGMGYYNTFLHIDLGRPREWGKEKWND